MTKGEYVANAFFPFFEKNICYEPLNDKKLSPIITF
jgi:hypothetical protein